MSERVAHLSEKTRIPIGWVLTLLAGSAGATTITMKIGQYVGGTDANATALTARVAVVENRVDVLELLDRRLARIEGKLGIQTPEADQIRMPANAK